MAFIAPVIAAAVTGGSLGSALISAGIGLVASITLTSIAGSVFRPKQPKLSDPFAGAQRTQIGRAHV